ncbi:MAG: hypothetical protein Q4G69_11795 [Planctomycetia bacterium]|nr:hypothetical protein [Planctomycetia bacterium]
MSKIEGKEDENEGLSPLAIGYGWVARITSISIEAALFVLGAFWLDRYLGTIPFLTIFGALAACMILVLRLYTLVKSLSEDKTDGK